jgi:hypothetical protein
MKWFNIYWYKYLFKDCTGIRNFICRINGHSCGVIWYNSTGLEPDMHCKNCYEDLG